MSHREGTGTPAGGPAVMVLAHNDDEVFINARIRALIRSGGEVQAVWLTAGLLAPSPDTRREESRAAMAYLGVPAEKLSFWDYPDLRTLGHLEEIVSRLASYLSTAVPAEIYVPSFEGGHPDHDVANFAVSQAVCRSALAAQVYEFPVTNACRGRVPVLGGFVPDSVPVLRTPRRPEDRRVWLRLWQLHRSQYRYLRIPLALCLDRSRWREGEPYRPLPRHNYLERPHGGRLGYERLLGFHFGRFRSAVREYLEAHGA